MITTFVVTYSPTDEIKFEGSPKFFGNDVAIIGNDFPEALELLRNPDRCPDCMSQKIDFSNPLVPACEICGFSGTLNRFRPTTNILTHVILAEPIIPGGRQFFLYRNITEARKDFERMFAEMEFELELILDAIEDKEDFWGSIFKPEGPKGEVLCFQ